VAEIDVRPARRANVRELAGVLGRAFYADPVMMWMLPINNARAKGLPTGFASIMRHHFLARDASEVASRDGVIGAAALWDPPGQWKTTRREEWLMKPGFLWAYRSRVPAAEKLLGLMKEHHPEEPHWYLMIVGSDPTVRGGGFGRAFMQSRLDRCDAEGVPAYLENTNPQNEAFYMRCGFEVSGEIKLPDGGPSIRPMWRSPH
jgi:RimJ/RimL family protein N-acetyltransferase